MQTRPISQQRSNNCSRPFGRQEILEGRLRNVTCRVESQPEGPIFSEGREQITLAAWLRLDAHF